MRRMLNLCSPLLLNLALLLGLTALSAQSKSSYVPKESDYYEVMLPVEFVPSHLKRQESYDIVFASHVTALRVVNFRTTYLLLTKSPTASEADPNLLVHEDVENRLFKMLYTFLNSRTAPSDSTDSEFARTRATTHFEDHLQYYAEELFYRLELAHSTGKNIVRSNLKNGGASKATVRASQKEFLNAYELYRGYVVEIDSLLKSFPATEDHGVLALKKYTSPLSEKLQLRLAEVLNIPYAHPQDYFHELYRNYQVARELRDELNTAYANRWGESFFIQKGRFQETLAFLGTENTHRANFQSAFGRRPKNPIPQPLINDRSSFYLEHIKAYGNSASNAEDLLKSLNSNNLKQNGRALNSIVNYVDRAMFEASINTLALEGLYYADSAEEFTAENIHLHTQRLVYLLELGLSLYKLREYEEGDHLHLGQDTLNPKSSKFNPAYYNVFEATQFVREKTEFFFRSIFSVLAESPNAYAFVNGLNLLSPQAIHHYFGNEKNFQNFLQHLETSCQRGLQEPE